jgi:ABC-type nitrate/sulfonate/bicarbonate transport system permease component
VSLVRRHLGGIAGIVSLLVVWELAGRLVFDESRIVPPPTGILDQMATDGWDFYSANASTTIREAAVGWAWGNALAIVVALVFVLLPFTEKALMRLAIASYCLPIVAIGPILQILFPGDTPKVILAALSVFFVTLIGLLLGLRSADRTSLDLVHAYGGNAWDQLRKVRLWASMPSVFAGLRIAGPAAVLGAIIGEYTGGESGLGVAMINSQQALKVERTWGVALAATAVAAVAYGIPALVSRLAMPWAPQPRARVDARRT